MFNNVCLPERAAELVQLAMIESRAERRLKHILTAQLLALKERALLEERRAPTNSAGCAQYGLGVGGAVFTHSLPRKNAWRHARTACQMAS